MVKVLNYRYGLMKDMGYTILNRADQGSKTNIDIDLAVDLVVNAFHKNMDHAIIFSGDSDFCKPISVLKFLGIKVTVVSSMKSETSNGSNPTCSDALKKIADHYVELNTLQEFINEDSHDKKKSES